MGNLKSGTCLFGLDQESKLECFNSSHGSALDTFAQEECVLHVFGVGIHEEGLRYLWP